MDAQIRQLLEATYEALLDAGAWFAAASPYSYARRIAYYKL